MGSQTAGNGSQTAGNGVLDSGKPRTMHGTGTPVPYLWHPRVGTGTVVVTAGPLHRRTDTARLDPDKKPLTRLLRLLWQMGQDHPLRGPEIH